MTPAQTTNTAPPPRPKAFVLIREIGEIGGKLFLPRARVLTMEDGNNDSEEPGQFGHATTIGLFRGCNNRVTDWR